MSEQSANHALWEFNQHLRKSQGFRPECFWVTEWQERRHVPHFHGLLLNVAGLRRLDVKGYWERYGFARVEAEILRDRLDQEVGCRPVSLPTSRSERSFRDY